MKFLCPQCKAKYKIADTKVANRAAPRMKCRKCGHVIDIKAAAAAVDTTDSVLPPPPVVPRARTGRQPPPRPRTAPRGRTPEPPRPAPVATPMPPSSRPSAAPAPQDLGGGFEDEPTVIKDVAALSSAFTDALEKPDSAPDPSAGFSDEWYVGIDGVPTGPLAAAEFRERAGAGKITEESLVWREGFEDWKPLKAFPELVSVLTEMSAAPPVVVADFQQPQALQAAQPIQAVAPEVEGAGPVPPVTTSDIDLDEFAGFKKKKRRHGTPPAAWIALVIAVLFGVTIGVVFFSTKERQEVVKYVEVPSSAEKKDPGEAPDEDEAEPAVLDEATIAAETRRSGGGTAAASTGAPAAKNNGKTGGLLAGLNGVQTQGPQAGSGTGTTGGSAGGQLDSNAIQRTVSNYSASVRRSCWQPALDTRSKDAPSSARVNVSITVAPSGTVQSVSTGGDPRGYRGLARCIESRVRSWKFPRSSGTTTVNVPFVFAAQ